MGLVAGEGLRTQTGPSFDTSFQVSREVVAVAGPADSWRGRVFGPKPGCRSTHPFRWVGTAVVVAVLMDSWRGRVFGPKPRPLFERLHLDGGEAVVVAGTVSSKAAARDLRVSESRSWTRGCGAEPRFGADVAATHGSSVGRDPAAAVRRGQQSEQSTIHPALIDGFRR